VTLTPSAAGDENCRVDTPARAGPAPRRLPERRAIAVRHTLLVILALNLAALIVKIAVGIRTGALSVLGAALESGLDLFNNIVGILLVRVAARGPDEGHPYGHEKFETLGALAIVGFLSISCFELLRTGVDHVVRGHVPRTPSGVELGLVGFTMALNVFVVWHERRRGRELHSTFLLADATHTRSDLYVTGAALGSLLLSRAGFGIVDPLLAIIVALVIAWNGYAIVRDSVPVLVDARAVDAAEIRRLLSVIPRIADVRNVRSRANASGMVFAEVTIGVDGETTVADAHRIADAVEDCIAAELGASEVTVHVEPV
jgi:cation diffusion facilitator family transporter